MTQKPNSKNLEITPELLGVLTKEGNRAWEMCLVLNADKRFTDAVKLATDTSFSKTTFKAQHILLNDVVKAFNMLSVLEHNNSSTGKIARFILVYLYEKLQGKDLLESFGQAKIQNLPLSNQFNKNISTIRETFFFRPIDELKTEFALPAILKKIKNEEFQNIASFLNRISLMIAKSDTKISPKEEEILKKISQKISNPKIGIRKGNYNEIPEDDTLEKVMKELNELVGLENIKKNVEDLTNFLKIQKIREEKGLKTSNNSLHAVFMGPPGTGKTTVARLLGRIFKHLGYLDNGHLVETDRAGMVAGYVGQTAIKSNEIITTALDGVLFIDEAYSLTSGGLNDFGSEAIEIILKRMEDNRNNLVVVAAGYPDEMEFFIQSNPGLQSRFNRYFTFAHFSKENLLAIFKLIAKKGDFILTQDAEDKLSEIIHKVHEKKHRGFGNARTMRNLFEKIIERQANRIVKIDPITEEILTTLTEEDVPEILKTVKEILVFNEEE